MANKKQNPEIPVREDWDPDEWGNIKHSTLSDEEVLTKDWEKSARAIDNWKDPKYRDKIISFLKKHNTEMANDPKWIEQNAKKWRAVAKDKNIQKKRIKNLKKAIQDPEVQKKKAQSFKQTMQKPGGKDNIISAAQKRSKDPKWIENHQKLQTMKSTDPKYQDFRDRMKQIGKEKGIKCQVKEPNGEWLTFDTFSDAAKHYNWNNLSSSPKGCFPEDGSIKQWKQKLRKGWQTRRIIND